MSQSTSCKMGVSPSARTTSATFPLGELTFGEGGESLLYVKATADIAANISVTTTIPAFTIAGGSGAFSSGDNSWKSGDFGWVIKLIEV